MRDARNRCPAIRCYTYRIRPVLPREYQGSEHVWRRPTRGQADNNVTARQSPRSQLPRASGGVILSAFH